jgi:hypothetical protein
MARADLGTDPAKRFKNVTNATALIRKAPVVNGG